MNFGTELMIIKRKKELKSNIINTLNLIDKFIFKIPRKIKANRIEKRKTYFKEHVLELLISRIDKYIVNQLKHNDTVNIIPIDITDRWLSCFVSGLSVENELNELSREYDVNYYTYRAEKDSLGYIFKQLHEHYKNELHLVVKEKPIEVYHGSFSTIMLQISLR